MKNSALDIYDEQGLALKLKEAKKDQNIALQIELINKLAEQQITKADSEFLFDSASSIAALNYNRGVALYNYALNLCQEALNNVAAQSIEEEFYQTKIAESKNVLYELAVKFSHRFEYELTIDKNDFFIRNQQHQKYLQDLHEESNRIFNINKEESVFARAKKTYQITQDKVDEFFKILLTESIRELGIEPPCQYTIIGFGSLARGEMTPYSDIEWGILIAEDTLSNKQYFRQLTHLVHFKVINLGKTIIPAMEIHSLNWLYDSTTKRGFAFDGLMLRACKWPLGNIHLDVKEEEKYELIHTPKDLANFQNTYLADHEADLKNHLNNLLMTARKIVGDETIFINYQDHLWENLSRDTVLSTNELGTWMSILEASGEAWPIRTTVQEQSLKLLLANIETYSAQIHRNDEEGKIFKVKAELYRLPSLIIEGLSLFFGIRAINTWERIKELADGGYINTKTEGLFYDLISLAMQLRLMTYSGLERQNENLAALPIITNSLVTTETSSRQIVDKQLFFDFYSKLLPLERAVSKFCNLRKEKFIENDRFSEEDEIIIGSSKDKGLVHKRLMQYDQAAECFKKQLSITPDDFETCLYLGNVLASLNKKSEALEYLKRAKSLADEEANYLVRFERSLFMISNIAALKTNMGHTDDQEVLQPLLFLEDKYKELKEEAQSRALVDPRDEELAKMLGEKLADTRSNLGKLYEVLNDYDAALYYYKEALATRRQLYNNRNIKIAYSSQDIGKIYFKQGKYSEALSSYQEAQQIAITLYGNQAHSELIKLYHNLGVIYKKVEDPTNAYICFEIAKEIRSMCDVSDDMLITSKLKTEEKLVIIDEQQLTTAPTSLKVKDRLLENNPLTKTLSTKADLVTSASIATNLSQAGEQMTGDQLAALLQITKESSGIAEIDNLIEFTPTITTETLNDFITQALTPNSLKKIQFAVINVVSHNHNDGRSMNNNDHQPIITSAIQKAFQVQAEMPGEHWISYIQIPNLFDADGNVVSVRAIILNSAGENYAPAINGLKNRIEEIFAQNNIQLTLPIKHLDYQKHDFEQYQDWNTCGIWACKFFEQTIEKIVKAKNPSEVKFEEITGRIDIAQKRQEYDSLLKVLDVSTLNTKTNIGLEIDKILDIKSPEADSILEEIDKELSEKFSINSEELDLDKLLENEDLKESISADNILSLVLNSLEAKELIKIIKDNASPPILDEETDLAKDQRLATLTKAFIDLAKLYIDKADTYDGNEIKQTKIQYFTEATKLLNYALSIRQDIVDKTVITTSEENRKIYYTLESTLEEINRKLINVVGGDLNRARITSALKNAILDKADLKDLREYSKTELEEIDKLPDEDKTLRTRSLFEHITNTIKSYLARMYQESELILGPKPCDYTVIGLGSMALNQMTPYSDLEFAILTTNDEYKNDPRTKDYFSDLTHLVNFRIINLGETVIHEKNIGGALIYDLIHRGVNLDLGGKTPLVVEGKPELIQTVDNMLVYLRNEKDNTKWFDTSAILEATCSVHGNADLYNIYRQDVNQFLFHELNKDGNHNYEARALKRLQDGVIEKELVNGEKGTIGNLEEFAPKLIGQNDEGRLFNVKQEIYRLPDRLLYNLALLYEIQPKSAWDAIDQLKIKGIIGTTETNKESVHHLHHAVTFAVSLRLKTYLKNQGQREEVHIFDVDKLLDQEEHTKYLKKVFYLSDNSLSEEGELFKYYYTVLPLHQQLKILCNQYMTIGDTEKITFFYTNILYNNDNVIKGYIYCRLGRYHRAISYLENDLKIQFNQNSMVIINDLGNMHISIGEYDKATKYYHKSLIIQSSLFINSPYIATSLNNLGIAYSFYGKFDEAIKCYVQSLTIQKIIYKDSINQDIDASLGNLGVAYLAQGQIDKSIKCFILSLHTKKVLCRDFVDIEIIKLLQNIATAYSAKGEFNTAIKYYLQSLRIQKIIYKSAPHPELASSLNAMGEMHRLKGNFDEAIKYYTQSLEIAKIIYNNSLHPEIAGVLHNLNIVYRNKGDFNNALEYSVQSLEMRKAIYKNILHPDIVNSLYDLGILYGEMGNLDEAIKYYTQSLELAKSIYKDFPHPLITSILDSIGDYYGHKGNHDEAIKYYLQSIEIYKIIYKEAMHPDIARTLNNLGSAYHDKSELDKAIEYYTQSLEINKIIYKDIPHTSIACILHNLGDIYSVKEELDLAIEYHIQSIEMSKKLYKNEIHPDIAMSLNSLGVIFKKKKEFGKATEYYIKCLDIQKAIYKNIAHPNFSMTLYNLGNLCSLNDDLNNAINYYSQALEIIIKFSDHPHTNYIMNGLVHVSNLFAELYIFNPEKIVNIAINSALQGYNFADYKLHYALASQYYQNNNLEETIEKYSLALIFCPGKEKQTQISISHNLGCMYHIASIRAKENNNFEQENEYYQKSEKLFKQALDYSEGNISLALNTEYINFLYQSQRYEEAIIYFLNVVANPSSVGGLNYGHMEKLTVSEDLQNEIGFYGEITITDPVVFAYYLLINAQIKLNNIEQANILGSQFKDYITSDGDSLAYSLLGYSYKNLKRFIEASEAFEHAANLYQITENKPEYTLAIENQAVCLSMVPIPTISNNGDSTINSVNIATGAVPKLLSEAPMLLLENEVSTLPLNIKESRDDKNINKLIHEDAMKSQDSQEEKAISPSLTTKLSVMRRIVFYHDGYRKAQASDDIPTQLRVMKELASVYRAKALEHSDELAYAKASGIVNYCINLCKDKNGLIKEEFREDVTFFNEQLLEIENDYLITISGNQIDNSVTNDEVIKYKTTLKNIRDITKARLDEINRDYYVAYVESGERSEMDKVVEYEKSEQIRLLFSEITERMKALVVDMIADCQRILGEAPCEYAIIAFGSMARKEMTPFSDFEWGILLEDEIGIVDEVTQKKKQKQVEKYFTNLSKYLQIKIINLGETILPSLAIAELNDYNNKEIESPRFYDDITPRGFSMDGLMPSASKWPLGNAHVAGIAPEHKFKLIGTATELAKLHDEQHYQLDKHFTTVLSTVSLVHGSARAEELIDIYRAATTEELRQPSDQPGNTIQQKRALQLLTEAVEQFGYNGGKFSKEGHYLDAKQLYRVPNLFIEHLSLYFNIEGSSVWEKIEALQHRRASSIHEETVLRSTGASNLKIASSMALSWRLNAYLERREQKDEIISLGENGLVEGKLKEVLNINRAELFRVYYSFILLTDHLRSFINSGGKKITVKEDYYDNSYFARGGIYSNLLELDKALECYEKDEAVVIATYGQNSLEFVNTYISKAIVYMSKGNYDIAQKYLENALAIKIAKEDAPAEIATLYGNLGSVCNAQGNSDMALQHYNKVLEIVQNISPTNPLVPKTLLMIGNIHHSRNNDNEALIHYRDALTIQREVSHPDIAENLNNIGSIYRERKEYTESMRCLSEALNIQERYLGKEHPNIAITLNNIGSWHRAQENYAVAAKFYEDALRIQKHRLPLDHPDIANTYNNIGNLYADQKQHEEALPFYDKALSIRIKQGQNHQSVATILKNKARAYRQLELYEQAIDPFKEALRILNSQAGQHSPERMCEIADILSSLGSVQFAFAREAVIQIEASVTTERYEEAVSNYKNALKIWKELQEQGILLNVDRLCEVADTSAELGLVQFSLARMLAELDSTNELIEEKLDEAMMLVQTAKEIYEQNNPNHINHAKTLRCLGDVYDAYGNNLASINCYKGATNLLYLKEGRSEQFSNYCLNYANSIASIEDIKEQRRALEEIITTYELNILERSHFIWQIVPIFVEISKQSAQLSFDEGKIAEAIITLETVDKLYPDMFNIYQNLGCYYHVYALLNRADMGAANYATSLEKAENSFIKSMESGGLVDYTLFLYKNFRFTDVVLHLEREVTEGHNKELYYSGTEKCRMPEELQKEIEFFGEIDIDSRVLAYYLLINVQIKLGNIEKAKELIMAFKVIVVSNPNALAYSLLAYSYKNLEQFTDAAEAFEQATSLYQDQAIEDKPEYTLAIENQALCLSMTSLLPVVEDIEVRHMVSIYQNPLLNYIKFQSIYKTAYKIGGIEAINNLIELGKDVEIARAIIEATKLYGARHVLSIIFVAKSIENLRLLELDSVTNKLMSNEQSSSVLVLSDLDTQNYNLHSKENNDHALLMHLVFNVFEGFISKLSIKWDLDINWQFKKFIYYQDVMQFNVILQDNGIDKPIDVLRDYSDFRKSVLLKIHPDKGGNNADFIFIKGLQEKLTADLNFNQLLADKMQTIQPAVYKAGIGFKILDTVVDAARLVYEPTIDHTKKLALDFTYLYSMYSGVSGYSLGISAADILYQTYQGEYIQALKQAVTSVSYMALPTIIGYTGIPYISFVYGTSMMIYTGYGAVTNAYSFYQGYGSAEFELKSLKAYKEFTQVLSIPPLQKVYDFTITSKGYEIKINNIHLDLEKMAIKVQSEAKGEFGQKLYNYIYAPALEEKYGLLNKVIEGILTEEQAEVSKLKHIKLTLESQVYEHCIEIKNIENSGESINKEHYYCYNNEQQILEHLVIGGVNDIEVIERL